MFFKRPQHDSAPAVTGGQVTTVAARPQPLEAGELRRVVNPSTLGFKTTDELHPISGLIGQDRALKAIQFGTSIKSHDFNIFVLGPPARKDDGVTANRAKAADPHADPTG